MRVHVITEGTTPPRVVPEAAVPAAAGYRPASYGPWSPLAVLGAQSAGGLLLPDAHPSSSTLYAPRGVWIDDSRVVVADTGNHRVLIWNSIPESDGVAADVVLGQPDATSEGQANGGAALGMSLPTGVLITEGRLIVADAWHHRILIWDCVPSITGTPPDHVLGQPDRECVAPNSDGDATACTFYWPFGVALIDGRFYVTDTGNRRVLVWTDGVPQPGQPADIVLGQPDAVSRDENRGVGVGPASFRWPHDVAGTGTGGVLVADAGNHRVLRWDERPETDAPADAVLGQPDFSTGIEFPYISQRGRLRFPYAISTGDGTEGLALADTANNRVLMWEEVPQDLTTEPDYVLAQPDLASTGENRWDHVAADTLCWPYGLHRRADLIAVADSGNNRVVLWRRS